MKSTYVNIKENSTDVDYNYFKNEFTSKFVFVGHLIF